MSSGLVHLTIKLNVYFTFKSLPPHWCSYVDKASCYCCILIDTFSCCVPGHHEEEARAKFSLTGFLLFQTRGSATCIPRLNGI